MKRQLVKRRGIVLIAVLVVVALLALSAYTVANWIVVENDLSAIEARRVQARLNADSAASLVSSLLDAHQRGQAVPNLFDNPELFSGLRLRPDSPLANAVGAGDEPTKNVGRAAVFSMRNDGLTADSNRLESNSQLSSVGTTDVESQAIRFGIDREGGRIHLSRWLEVDAEALKRAMMTLPHATEALVDAVLDWLDADDVARPAGAERREYETRPVPVQPRNGPVADLDELLMVRGMTREIWFGSADGRDPGWRHYLTRLSRERNVDRFGRPRIWLNDPNVDSLVQTLTQEFDGPLAEYVRAVRRQPDTTGTSSGRLFHSVWELVDGTVVDAGKSIESPLRSTDPALAEKLPDALDRLTATAAPEFVGRVDLLSATPAALELLPLAAEQRQAILERRPPLQAPAGSPVAGLGQRQSRPPETLAWLLTEHVLTIPEIIAIEPHATASSPVVRFEAAGFFDEGREAVRIEYAVDATSTPAHVVERRPHGPWGVNLSLPALGQGSPTRPLPELK